MISTPVSRLRKRRGVIRASITRLGTRLTELEDTADQPRTLDHTRQLLGKLWSLDEEFRGLYYELIDLIDAGNEDALDAEEAILDKHDDDVAMLTIRLEALSTAVHAPSQVTPDPCKPLARKLSPIKTGLQRIRDMISATDTDIESSISMQCQEETADYRSILATLYDELLSQDIADDDELCIGHSTLERDLSDISSQIKILLIVPPSTTCSPRTTTDSSGVKLPKLDVPTFNGNIIHWKQFWDQFSVSIHDHTNLSSTEKIIYLQHALKDGSAKNAIEGLSHSGENYDEAVKCLKSQYDRPQLIHHTHVQMIVDAPPLKEGNGRELRKLHDNVQQHVRALKTLGCDLPKTFITSMIELKLDVNTLFQCQKHSQKSTVVPHYESLLEFIDLRVQASETSCAPQKKKPPSRITSFTASANSNCVLCKNEKHPLYVCAKFKDLPHVERLLQSKQTTSVQIVLMVDTSSDSANQHTNAQYARRHITPSYTLIHQILRHLLVLHQ